MPTPGVPAILFRSVRIDVRAFPADPVALGLRPDRVPAFGLGDTFVLDDPGTFFDRFVVTPRPDRGLEPFALVMVAGP